MKRWHKIGLGLYTVASLFNLVGCTESNIPKGTVRANGLPSTLSIQLLPDSTLCSSTQLTVLATVKDELGNPGNATVIFATNGNPGSTATAQTNQLGVATGTFTFTVNASVTAPVPVQVFVQVGDLSQTVNVTVLNCL